MSYITPVKENLCYFVGMQLDCISSQEKRWFVIAGLVGGWAVGFFFVSRAMLPAPAAFALMTICSYAFARLATDTASLTNLLASWLLQEGGEAGRRYLAAQVRVL